jgi:hypothetical protein
LQQFKNLRSEGFSQARKSKTHTKNNGFSIAPELRTYQSWDERLCKLTPCIFALLKILQNEGTIRPNFPGLVEDSLGAISSSANFSLIDCLPDFELDNHIKKSS